MTSELSAAVKYVPYSSIISVDTIHQWLTTKFEVIGDLPEWLTLNETNGELYGIPLETGTFSLEIKATTSWDGHEDDYSASVSRKWLTLEVKDNTDENVFNASDEGYTIKTSIGEAANQFDFVLSEDEIANDQEFTSNGEYGNFIDFWLNGERLIEGTDYTSEEGSTKITIKSQTISRLPKDKANTIAAEFRIDGKIENDLKKTAQNFTIKTNDKPDTSPDDNPDGSGDSDNSSDNNTSDSTSSPDTSDSTSTPDTSDNTSSPNTPDNTNTPSTPDNIGASSSTSDNTGDSAPTEGDIVFRPVPVSGDMADIINGITIVCRVGVMSEDAVLIVEPDSSISISNGIALDITFTLDNVRVQPNGTMTARIPVPNSLKGVTPLYVYHITDGKFNFVDSWIDGEYVCYKANSFSTYIVSGKRLDINGNEITADAPGTSENPITGIDMSATGMLISGAALTIILLNRKKR